MRLIFFSLFFLTACAPFGPSPRDVEGELPAHIPNQYMSAQIAYNPAKSVSSPWWQNFQSDDLNKIMTKALGSNFDILTAWAKLRQSQSLVNSATADFFPQIGLDGSMAQRRIATQTETDSQSTQGENNSNQTKSTLQSTQVVNDSYNISVAASFELDLWGRINSERQAELLRADATRNDLQTAAISVAGSVAETWAALLGNRAELAVLNEQITINEDLVEVQTQRFSNGLSTSLEVLQQQAILAEAKAEVPVLEQQAAILRNQLAILQGTLPGTGLQINEAAPLPTLGSMPEPGLPIQLLDARPDVNAAWARLAASDWDVSAAHAKRYPALKLSATHVFEAANTSLLLTNWVSSLIGSLAMTVFDGGALAADEARIRAETDINVQNYAKTVAMAIQEVDNALAAEKGESENLRLLEEQYSLTKAALMQARNSYLGGVSDFLNFIVELKSIQNLQRSIARQKTAVVQARITLYRTLGSLQFPLSNQLVPAPASAEKLSISQE